MGRLAESVVVVERNSFPDVVRAVAEQTDGLFREDDFLPLPCAHPNCHSLSYAYRSGGRVVPLSRLIDAQNHLDLLANGITFTRPRARELIERYLGRLGCCAGNCDGDVSAASQAPNIALQSGSRLPIITQGSSAIDGSLAQEFFTRALAEQLSPADVFRITITSFLDAYNFDVRRLMKCCIHHILPSGHVVPFCAYNVLYRNGHVKLPALREVGAGLREGSGFRGQGSAFS